MKKLLLFALLVPIIAPATADAKNCSKCDHVASNKCYEIGHVFTNLGYVGYCTRRRDGNRLYATCGRGSNDDCTEEFDMGICRCD